MNPAQRAQTLIQSGTASERDFSQIGRDRVLAVKAATRAPQFRSVAREVTEEGDRVLRYTVSEESVDRMGDVIVQDGWDLANYRKNPVILWGHDADSLPVGRARSVTGIQRAGVNALVMDVEFASKEAHPFADTVYQLSKSGFLPATSVGFLPLDVHVPESAEEAKELGLGEFGVQYRRQEMLETSIVSVPAHPNAVQDGIKELVERGALVAEDASVFAERGLPIAERAWAKRIERAAESIEAPNYAFGDGGVFDAHGRILEPGVFNIDGKTFTGTGLNAVPSTIVNKVYEAKADPELLAAMRALTVEVKELRRSMTPGLVTRAPEGLGNPHPTFLEAIGAQAASRKPQP